MKPTSEQIDKWYDEWVDSPDQRAAWSVFTGRNDVLVWLGGQK